MSKLLRLFYWTALNSTTVGQYLVGAVHYDDDDDFHWTDWLTVFRVAALTLHGVVVWMVSEQCQSTVM
jgi:hypothetical protein